MLLRMRPNTVVHAGAYFLEHEAVPADQVVGGRPRTGVATLGQFGGHLMLTRDTLLIDACLVPGVVVGSLVGRRIVPFVPQRTFERVVLVLAAAASLYMLRTLIWPH